MILVNLFRRNVLKSPMRILISCRRNVLLKKKSRWLDSENPAFDKFQNSKLTPKGFEVIYITPFLKLLKWTYACLPFFWAVLLIDFYIFMKDENYIKKLNEKLKGISAKEKILQTAGIAILILVIHLILSRVVVATFHKEKEFQTLLYGFFGPLHKNYVPHGFQAIEPTQKIGIYNFKGKKVFILSQGFRNFESFSAVVKTTL